MKEAKPGIGQVKMSLREYDGLRARIEAGARFGAILSDLCRVLRCTYTELVGKAEDLISGGKDAEPGEPEASYEVEVLTKQRGRDERVGRLVRGMKHDDYLAKNDDGSYRASSDPPSFNGVGWYDGLNAADAMRQAGIEEAE